MEKQVNDLYVVITTKGKKQEISFTEEVYENFSRFALRHGNDVLYFARVESLVDFVVKQNIPSAVLIRELM